MAVAARPGASDARVPCPLCGGLIHPIAGKCKHCKADLTGYHAARPAASAPLPALHRAPSANGEPNGHPASSTPFNGHPPQTSSNGQAHAPAAYAPVATAVPPAHEAAVLPPRPTARSHTAEPVASAWRSWPVLVIVIAMVAIVAAVALMLWPESAARAGDPGKRPLKPPPAPERMPTTVPDHQAVPDRHTVPDRHNQAAPPRSAVPDPWGAKPADPPQDPGDKPADATDPDDDLAPLKNPFASPHSSRGGFKLNRPGSLLGTMAVHLCRKMIECGVDDPVVTNQCDQVSRMLPSVPINCPAAARCLQRIDAMACGSQPATIANITALVNQFNECRDALRC